MIGQALRGVRTEHLKALLRAVYRGDLQCPITSKGLAEAGLLHLGDQVDFLQGLEEQAVRAALVAVIAERGGR